jgi:hypothetical protein
MNARVRTAGAAVLAGMALILAACSGGSGSGSPGSSSTSTTPPATTYSGTFIDAPVQGLTWTASPSNLSGTTDASGAFSFQAGDTVSFSLGAGGSATVPLGSVQPSAPASGNAQLFVLSLANGLQVAQVLQSLNHGTVDAIDVGGLTLQASDVTNLDNYIASGGTALPAGDTSDLQMLSSVQTDSNAASAGYRFLNPGGTSVSATVTALQVTLSSLPASSATDLAAMVTGNVIFYQEIETGLSGIPSLAYDLDYFDASGSAAVVAANPGPGSPNPLVVGSGTYTASGNSLTLSTTSSGTTVTDTMSISYADMLEGLASLHGSDGSNGVGSFVFLTTITPADVAGRTLNLSGSIGICGAAAFQFVVAASGTSYTANCQGQAAGSAGSGAIAAAATVPGVLTFTDSTTGNVIYVGLIAGGTVSSGSVAVVSLQANGIFSLTS